MNEIDHARPQPTMFKVRSDGNKTKFRMWKTRTSDPSHHRPLFMPVVRRWRCITVGHNCLAEGPAPC